MDITIKSSEVSTLINLGGRKAYYGAGQVQPYTPDGSGNQVFIYDSTGKLQVQRIPIIIGVDNINVDGKTAFTDADDLLSLLSVAFFLSTVADYGTEVAQRKIPLTRLDLKFGRNSDIDTASVPEDVWNGGGLYTGFDCVVAERLSFVSSSALDTGSEIASGAATGGDKETLIDTAATFISSGVLEGDIVIDDTQQIHGIINSVDSETQISVFDFTDGENVIFEINPGDAYRIARATSTGAAVCKFQSMLDANYDSFSEYVIMNGLTPVLSVGSYLRQSRGKVVIAGSSDTNQGEIIGRQSVTVANVTMVMPATSGQTAICCDTVPRGKTYLVKTLAAQMSRAGGLPGSAQTRFQTRNRGEAWQTKRFPQITEALSYSSFEEGGIEIGEFADVRWNIQSVSDNNTLISAEFEFYELNNR